MGNIKAGTTLWSVLSFRHRFARRDGLDLQLFKLRFQEVPY